MDCVPHALTYRYRAEDGEALVETVVLDRALSDEEVEDLRETLLEGDRFVPSVVDLDDLRWRADLDDDAPPWHVLDVDEIEPVPGADPQVSADVLLSRFDDADWSPGSSHYSFG